MDFTLMLWTIMNFAIFLISESSRVKAGNPGVFTYTREYLLSLRPSETDNYGNIRDILQNYPELERTERRTSRAKTKTKKRGSRGGVRQRIKRRGCKHPLPVITLSNVRSLNNKMDELIAKIDHDSEFRQSNLLCFTETWLKEGILDPNLPGYTLIRADRDNVKSRKSIGGGMCIFVDNHWATQYTIRETVCTRDYEILVVSFRPFYLPREFGQITIILIYVPGPDFEGAATKIAESYNNALARSADQPVFILGDVNSCDLSSHLPALHQYVDCPTRLKRTLDKCYGNIPEAFKSVCRPALGKSDHNVIHLLPRYKSKLKREKTLTKDVQLWTDEARDDLRDCMQETDWQVFFDSNDNVHDLTETITSYIMFCESNIIHKKTVRIFPNNKSWITSDLKDCINEKKRAFSDGNEGLVREKRRELRGKLKKAKIDYKDRVETRFCSGNARSAWEGLNQMMGREGRAAQPAFSPSPSFVNDLNMFYGRFDHTDFGNQREDVCKTIPDFVPITLTEHEVALSLARIKPNKAAGPDGLRGKVLKTCAYQLKSVLTALFQIILQTATVPKPWKVSNIVPVPKKTGAKELNDFRPIALTSILCKCMERVISKHITSSVSSSLDNLQFAYKCKRGTDDASVTLFNSIAKHLQISTHYARVLFIDFTSAFNTMQIHILLQRLLDLKVNGGIIHWVRDFLSDRPQKVILGSNASEEIVLNTGSPQGTILSPLLFSIYTNEYMIHQEYFRLFKYADDMALVGLLQTGDTEREKAYFNHVSSLQEWCLSSHLQINVSKTKELTFQMDRNLAQHLFIEGEEVEIVNDFKYLGTYIDSGLNFKINCDFIFKKCSQRLYLLRKLNSFGVNKTIIETVYKSLVESILSFNMIMWYGNLNMQGRNKLNRVIKMGTKIIGKPQRSLDSMYQDNIRRKALGITSDPSHPLHGEFEPLPSGRRFRVPNATRNVYKKSFIPNAINVINKVGFLS